ncbi:hypothetical protein HK099_002625 [Clydaea vesicula]|uniref:Uncharacterized protein n=1 Tax=Clydaea vesicula TaxID=447962 RepID=A0AAD5U2S8_9FUNG|nr:hypothetical protein HK099_002625 [Clydaea vesicula]
MDLTKLRVRSIHDGKKVNALDQNTLWRLNLVASSISCNLLFVASGFEVKVFDLEFNLIQTLVKQNASNINAVRVGLLHDHEVLIVVDEHGFLTFWFVNDFKRPSMSISTGISAWGIAFHNKNGTLSCSNNHHTIHLVYFKKDFTVKSQKVLVGHRNNIPSIDFTDGTCRIWDVSTGETIRVHHIDHDWCWTIRFVDPYNFKFINDKNFWNLNFSKKAVDKFNFSSDFEESTTIEIETDEEIVDLSFNSEDDEAFENDDAALSFGEDIDNDQITKKNKRKFKENSVNFSGSENESTNEHDSELYYPSHSRMTTAETEYFEFIENAESTENSVEERNPIMEESESATLVTTAAVSDPDVLDVFESILSAFENYQQENYYSWEDEGNDEVNDVEEDLLEKNNLILCTSILNAFLMNAKRIYREFKKINKKFDRRIIRNVKN